MTDGREINTSRPLLFKRAMSVRGRDSPSRNCFAFRVKNLHGKAYYKGFLRPIHRDLKDTRRIGGAG